MGDDGFCGFSVPWRGTTASPQSQKVATPAAAASARPQGPLSPQKKMSGAPGCAIAAVYAFRAAAGVGSAKTAGDCLVAAGGATTPAPHRTSTPTRSPSPPQTPDTNTNTNTNTAMVVRLRLARFGRRHAPVYNIVVAHARSALPIRPSVCLSVHTHS